MLSDLLKLTVLPLFPRPRSKFRDVEGFFRFLVVRG